MAVKVCAGGNTHNVLPFTRNAAVKHPQPPIPSEMTIVSEYEALRDDLKRLNVDLATLKQQLQFVHTCEVGETKTID